MKRFITSLIVLAFTGLSSCTIVRQGEASGRYDRINWLRSESASRQQPSRYDLTYSSHNYKHANKAAYGRQLTGAGVPVSYPQPGLRPVANYKMPGSGGVPAGGVVVEHRPATDLTGGNYKMPRSGRRLWVPGQPDQPLSATQERLNRLPIPTSQAINPYTNKLN